MVEYKRLDRVVAVKSTTELTRGKVYTVLGVKKYKAGRNEPKSLLLIATDNKKRRYIGIHLFTTEEAYQDWEDKKVREDLEERGL